MQRYRYKIKIRHHFKDIVRGELFLPSVGIYLLKGPVGSGKTSILRELYFHKNRKHTFSYQTLDFPFAPGIKVIDHINMVKNATSIDGDKLEKILMKFNIYNLLENEIERLSDGEKERLMISLVLAERTPIALLDEPSARLDRLSISRLLEILEEERKSRIILLSTHSEYFEEIAKYTFRIESKVLSKIHDVSSLEKIEAIKFSRPKRKFPRSRLYQFLLVISASLLSALSLSTFLPLIEYISPTPKNFYYGPSDFSPNRYVHNNYPCHYCTSYTLSGLDLYKIPNSLIYSYADEVYRFNIDDYYRADPDDSYPSMFVYVEAIPEDNFSISQGFMDILEKKHKQVVLSNLKFGGLRVDSIIPDAGVFMRYPEKYIQNLSWDDYIYRYLTPDDIIYDNDLRIIELREGEIATSRRDSPIGTTVTIDKKDYKVGGYFISDYKYYLFNTKYDYSMDQYNIYLSTNSVRYSRSNIFTKEASKYYDVQDEFQFYKSLYKEEIMEKTLFYSFAVGAPSILVSILLLGIFLSLENLSLKKKRSLYLFYNTPRSSLLKPLAIWDVIPVISMVSTISLTLPLFIFVNKPYLNIPFVAVFSAVFFLLFLVMKSLISALLLHIHRRKLR